MLRSPEGPKSLSLDCGWGGERIDDCVLNEGHLNVSTLTYAGL